MQRRNFMMQSLLAMGGTLAGTLSSTNGNANCLAALAKSKDFQLGFAFHDGMFQHHAGPSFLDQIKFANDLGFTAIEDNGMMSRTKEQQTQIGELLAKLNMKMGVFVIEYDKWPLSTSLTGNTQAWRDKFITYCKMAVEVAKRCNAKWLTVVPGNYDKNLSLPYQTANVVESLKYAADILAPNNLIMVLEPLSDTPDLFLRRSDQTFQICKAVNSPACKILYDIYHMQRNEGDIIPNIDKAWAEIAYFQIGDNPGRNEPGTGELNYANIFQHIHQRGYRGIYGMEHGKSKGGKQGELDLVAAYRQVDIR